MTTLQPRDPRVRLTAGAAALVLSGLTVDHDRVAPVEQQIFRAINGLPDRLYPSVWVLMQGGVLGAVPVAAGVARLAGRPELVEQLLAAGSGTWLLAKVVKRIYRRPRPMALLASARTRGAEASGLGYVSGHAGIAVALAAVAYPHLRPRARLAIWAVVPCVGLSRVYVGAHLPLDAVGGAALGFLVESATELMHGWLACGEPARPVHVMTDT